MTVARERVVWFTAGVFGVLAGALGASDAVAAPSEALQACLAKCNKGKLSETNRETCRLDCELDAATDPEEIRAEIARRQPPPSGPKAQPGPGSTPTPAPVAAPSRAECKSRCDADRGLSVDDRATCKLECDLDEEPGGAARLAPGEPSPVSPATAVRPEAAALPAGVAASPVAAPMGFLTMCLQTCRSGPVRLSPMDLETCRLTCENAASVVDFALDAVPSMWMTVAVSAPQSVAVRLPSPGAPVGRPSVVGPPASPAAPAAAPAGSCEGALATCEGACGKARASCEKDCGRKHLKATDRESCKLDCGEGVGLCRGDCSAEHASCVNRRGG